MRLRDKAKIMQGRIHTIRQTASPQGSGWRFDRNTGLYVRETKSKNMIVLAGLTAMMKWIQYGHADQGGSIRYMAVGTGYTIPDKSDTALVSQLLRVEISSWDNTDIGSDPPTMIATYLFSTSQANDALMECGLFQNSSGAPMFCRGLFGLGYITDATQDDPCQITSADHGLTDGDKILIEGVAGMTELNGNSYYCDVQSSSTFDLYSDSTLSTSVNSGAYGAFSLASPNNATWKVIIPKTSAETLTINYSLSHPAD